MAHRRVRSQGSVPFAWEETPGVSKYSTQNEENKRNPNFFNEFDTNAVQKAMKISPPPCISSHPPFPHRSPSLKAILGGFRDDPFAKAIKECTKSIKTNEVTSSEGSTCFRSRHKKLSFSCKKSFDVKEDSLVKLRNHHRHCHHPSLTNESKIFGVNKDVGRADSYSDWSEFSVKSESFILASGAAGKKYFDLNPKSNRASLFNGYNVLWM